MRSPLSIIIAICLWIFQSEESARAQVFRHFSEKDGAPATTVLSIVQDNNGYIWYATSIGLYRYDSRSFKKYTNNAMDSTSISSNYVKSLFCDSNGTLWVGTLNGLNRYNSNTDAFSRFLHNPKDLNSISGDEVYDITEDSQNRLLIATSKGLNNLEKLGGKVKIHRYLHGKFRTVKESINKIARGENNQLWLATRDGLVRIEINGNNVILQTFRDKSLPSNNDFNCIYPDKKGNIWLSIRTGGLIRFNIDKGVFTLIDSFRDTNRDLAIISGFESDKEGKIWIATESGLANFDLNTHDAIWHVNSPVNPLSLADNVLMALAKDRQDGLWLGSYYLGISYLNTSPSSFSSSPFFTDPAVPNKFSTGWTGITPTDKLWVIPDDKSQILMFDKKTKNPSIHNLNLGFSLYSNHFYLDKNDIVWYSGNRSLSSYNIKTGHLKDYKISYSTPPSPKNDRIYRMIEDSRGKLWLAGGFGLLRFDKEKESFDLTGVKEKINCIFEDSKGNIWAGGTHSVWLIKNGSNQYKKFAISSKKTAGPDNVLRIVEDSAGRIWHITSSSLKLLDKAMAKFENYTLDNIALEELADIQADRNGNIWLSVGVHLVRHNPEKKISQLFTYEDGLPKNGMLRINSAFTDKSGIFYYATNKGQFSFNPLAIQVKNNESPIVLTSLKLFNKEVKPQDNTGILKREIGHVNELVFRHDQNIFTLDFSLLSYFKSDRNQYSYKLEDFEKDWNDVQIPSATYTNLPSGRYTFLVKAANGDGYWNKNPLRIGIVILAPWWQTWYAYLVYFLVFMLTVYAITRFFWLRNSLKKESELQQLKLNFFTNISHEIRTHLSLISGPLEKASQSSLINSDAGVFISQAKSSSNRLLNLVNELLDFRKIESGNIQLQLAPQDITKLLQNVLSAFEHVLKEKEIGLETRFPEAPVIVWIDEAQIQKVFYNLLSNALKFTPSRGRISISVTEISSEVLIKVTDNGVGIAKEYLPHLFTNFFQVSEDPERNNGYGIGLALTKEIIDMHKGDICVTSKQRSQTHPGITCFTLRFLKGKGHFNDSQISAAPIVNYRELHENSHDFVNGEELRDFAKKKTLLLIEDNAELRSFIKEALRGKYNILETEDGLKGLEMTKTHLPDLILCDVMMPVMDGFEVCRQIKGDDTTNHIPLVLLTAKSAIPHMIEGLELGADDYLIKPFDLKVLELKINNLIQVRAMLKGHNYTMLSLEPDGVPLTDPDAEFIIKLKNMIIDNVSDPNFGVGDMAFHAGISVSVLYRKLRTLTGMTVNDFVKVLRMKRALQLLETGSHNVNEVANAVGYEDTKYFSREFKKIYGKNPNEIRKQSIDT